MDTRTYVNFDLLVEKEADGSYTALVTGSPVGAASVRFRLPFDATTLENLLLKLDPGRSGTRRSGANVQQQAAMDFGGPLYDAIFRDELLLAWSRSQDRTREQGVGLRLRLRLTDAAEIAGLPWELLYDAPNNSFIAQSERTPVVRYLDIPSVPRTIKVDGPLRVLAVIASPTDLETLDVEGEWERLQEAMADRIEAGSVVLDRLPRPVVSALGPWLRRHQTHVIHFVGHGDFDERLREGVVYFEDDHGARAAVTSSVLGPFVRDHDPLRMVVLNACRSARTDALDPFGGLAQGLVQQDATAVVAMQFPISDRAAMAFTSDFYGSLVDGLPVDQAITSARKSLLGGFRDEWATPVLFLRAPDGAIFEDVHAEAGSRPHPAPITARDADAPEHDRSSVDGHDDDSISSGGANGGDGGSTVTARRRRVVVTLAVAAAAVGAAAAAFVAIAPDGSNESDRTTSTEQTSTTGGGGATADLPVAESPLSDDQLLVAAGRSNENLNIYRVDLRDGSSTRVTTGLGRKAGPSISEDRRSLIITEKDPEAETFQLRAVDPATGEDDDVLLENRPAVCARSMERPARSPANTDVVIVACLGETDLHNLVEIDLGTGRWSVLDTRMWLGDPTVSPDGEWVVYWAADEEDEEKVMGGTLWKLRLVDDSAAPQPLESTARAAGVEDSDAVFSPVDEDRLVFRRRTGTADYDLWTRLLDDPSSEEALVVGPDPDADPSYSPDGTRLAFKRGNNSTGTRVWVLEPVEPQATPRTLLPGPVGGFRFEMVPAWSRR